MLDYTSTTWIGDQTYKGPVQFYGRVVLPSVTTAERDLIPSPTAGTLIFNSTTKKLNFYTGTIWEAVTSA